MSPLHPRLQAELRELHDRLTSDGTLRPPQKIREFHDAFRRAFGPDVLRGLDGVELLELMHAHGNRESLVYWLEFKDDNEFPAIFGSIAGGSALKFGVYRRAETGTWATKGIGSAPKDIPLDAAIQIARTHRDQLLAAADAVGSMGMGRADNDYLGLQGELQRVAPAVEDTAWGHKYLTLLFPDVLEDFHVADLQRYHLGRVLQLPPRQGDSWAKGRYVCAARFIELAQELGVSLHDATTLLNRRNGDQRYYWRIGTTDEERERRKYWPLMRDANLIAVGWQKIGDLSAHSRNIESRTAITALVGKHYPGRPQQVGRSGSELFSFVTKLATGDRVVVADGQTVLAVAEVAGGYQYDADAGFPHQRPVTWKSMSEWPMSEGLRTSVFRLKSPETIVAIERHILEDAETVRDQKVVLKPAPERRVAGGSPAPRGPLQRLEGVPGQLQTILERKGQAILYGPPGTGKTFWALRTAQELAARRAFGAGFDELAVPQRTRIVESEDGEAPLVRIAIFHPEYGYEDFIEGYRPDLAADGSLLFSLKHGVFRRICADAIASPELDFYLVIDEINRGDVPRIFGELLTLLEQDKRGMALKLPLSGEAFRVPTNVFVIGTMNTADRSIALLDVALRRRFGFVELMPDYSLLDDAAVEGLPLGPWLRYINARIRQTGGGDARNRQIGHAFLLSGTRPIATVEQLAAVLRDDIVPLVEEYFYDDFTQIAEVFDRKLIDVEGQRVRRELLEAGRGADLVAALLRPEIVTTAGAVVADDSLPEDDGTDSPEADEDA